MSAKEYPSHENCCICFIGQMKYKHHRDKLAGILRFANNWGRCDIQQLDYTQIPIPLCCDLLKRMKLDGLIFGDGSALAPFTDFRRRTHVPTAVIDPLTFDFKGRRPDIAIELDHAEISRRIGDFFLKRGFMNFAYIGYNSDIWVNLDRLKLRSSFREKAFVSHIQEHGYACAVMNISGRLDDDEKHSVEEWLRTLPKPCAIMAYWDNLARDVADAARRAAVRIPEQVVVMGTDNDMVLCETSQPTLTSIDIDFEASGFLAAKELFALLDGKRPKGIRRLSYGTGEIVERTSTLDVKGSGRLVGAACEFIRQHATERIRIGDVAQFVHTSPRILQMRFAGTLHHSIIDEISGAKLARVKHLLKTSSLSNGEIAERCGYDAHHLVNFFKHKTGMSMGAYRRQS